MVLGFVYTIDWPRGLTAVSTRPEVVRLGGRHVYFTYMTNCTPRGSSSGRLPTPHTPYWTIGCPNHAGLICEVAYSIGVTGIVRCIRNMKLT